MKKGKKILALMMAASMTVMMLAGCGTTSDETTTTTDSSTDSSGSTESTSTGEALQIVIATQQVDGQNFKDILENAIAEFNSDYEGVYEIIHDALPSDAFDTNLAACAAASDLPDLSFLKGSLTRSWGELGLIIDVTELSYEYGLADRTKDGAYTEHSIDGQYYAFPLQAANYGYIYYNTEIFAEVGVTEFPSSTEELIEVSQLLLDAGYIPMALGDKDLWPGDSITFSAFVNPYVGNDWTESITNCDGVASFTDAGFISALADFQSLATTGVFNTNLASINNDEAFQLYMTGEAAMKSAGDWENSTLVESAPEIAAVTEVAAWPGPETGALAEASVEQSVTFGVALSASMDEEKIPGAMIFLSEYFMTEESGQELTATKGIVSAWEAEYDPEVLDEISAKVFDLADEAQACSNFDSILLPSTKLVYQQGLQALLLDEITPEALAQEIQDAYETELE